MQVYNHKRLPFKEEVANLFGITSFSGYRPGDSGDHGKGLAIDFMVPVSSALGDQIADYAIQNMASRGISYIIWKQRFYAPLIANTDQLTLGIQCQIVVA